MKRPLKMITAMGTNNDLVLEIIDFFNSGDRFTYNAEAEQIRRKFSGQKLCEIYLICTQGVIEHLTALKEIIRQEYPALADHIHEIFLDGGDISCAADDAAMRHVVYEQVQNLSSDDLIIASAGRKPVTQRLIEAGLLYGCLGYLTITAPQNNTKRSDSHSFNVLLTSIRQFSEERRSRIIKDELGDNFRSIYLLPPQTIQRLRSEVIGSNSNHFKTDLQWLHKLPKSDLHCHLGGAYDPKLLKKMAALLLNDLAVSKQRRNAIRQKIETRLKKPLNSVEPRDIKGKNQLHPLNNLDNLCQHDIEPDYICKAVFLDALTPEQINNISRDGLPKENWPKNLSWYMACGDFGGSTLLQTENNLRTALQWLMAEGKRENVRFMEIRFSPGNYTRAKLSIRQVIDILLEEARLFTEENRGFYINFLIMATRHKSKAAMAAHVAAAVSYGQPGSGTGPRITGFDLAGQEDDNDPVQFKEIFMPLHYHFMNITIHAGEMAAEDKIWQALYDLHARRVGHGLKLIHNRKMMDYVRDYKIAIEMCPSSNIQTNKFRSYGRDKEGGVYPLQEYMQHGITVTINTDNRGISDTTMSNEYLEAARLTEGGLSKWEILRLVKNGFKAAFLPKDEKDRLIKEIDDRVFHLILDEYCPKSP